MREQWLLQSRQSAKAELQLQDQCSDEGSLVELSMGEEDKARYCTSNAAPLDLLRKEVPVR